MDPIGSRPDLVSKNVSLSPLAECLAGRLQPADCWSPAGRWPPSSRPPEANLLPLNSRGFAGRLDVKVARGSRPKNNKHVRSLGYYFFQFVCIFFAVCFSDSKKALIPPPPPVQLVNGFNTSYFFEFLTGGPRSASNSRSQSFKDCFSDF